MLSARIPATSANLGPGFDCLGLALNLFNTITVEKSSNWEIRLSGKYTADLPVDESNLVWKTILYLWEKVNYPTPKLTLTLENNIPPARGLGSSSAAIVGGLVVANSLAGNPFSQLDLLQMANELEGHPDNVTPALYGGVTLAVETAKGILPRVLNENPYIDVLVVIPEFLLNTSKSRKVLTSQVSRSDAVFNIAHAGLIIEAFIRGDYTLLKEGMRDRLHQDQRAALVPGLPEALSSALNNGAYGAALSGSGPTLLAFLAPEYTQDVAEGMVKTFANHGLNAQAYPLEISPRGAHIL
ncbi:homoserine kinase [Desulfitobacterium metallireducens]|uniref:Homoserine kinase n=1 Tax=Desulfitobacterium metallireducens DSM 15288 TaxID=871968 RepID=W0EAQ0_9FIRM|nr:homoserine kinase [Desulfitobacterium metallireducens]AHF06608.1 homoserine kinase [Desulfitobacterium metallireducens DSM 15288]